MSAHGLTVARTHGSCAVWTDAYDRRGLDLADVTFIDVSGSRALSTFAQHLEMHGVDVVHGACSRVVTRLGELLAGQGAGRNVFSAAAAKTGADMLMLSESRS